MNSAITTDALHRVEVLPLGQVGFRLKFGEVVVFIDPYLSDFVEQAEGQDLRRHFPLPFAPGSVTDTDWVMITHEHIDHCDPLTLSPLAAASPQARFVAPAAVRPLLLSMGIAPQRVLVAREDNWLVLADDLKVIAVPSAHPDVVRDAEHLSHFVGYIFDFRGRRLYHAGDTSVTDEVLDSLRRMRPIDVGFLPVNERNYFRDRRGIIGNMSVREAFGLAEEVGIRTVVPTHWDMFGPNCVDRQEIELLYQILRPNFAMAIYPKVL